MSLIVIKGGKRNVVPLAIPNAEELGLSPRITARLDSSGQLTGGALPELGPTAELEVDLELAKAEAEGVLEQARTRASEIEAAACNKGLQEGRAAAAAEIAAGIAREIGPIREHLTRTLEQLITLRAMLAEWAEHELVRLALEIAKKIVHREVVIDQEVVTSIVRVALSRLHNYSVATIRLHPEDYRNILAHRDRLASGADIRLLEDPSVGRGGCMIESDLGNVDARVDQQFAEIERGFFGT